MWWKTLNTIFRSCFELFRVEAAKPIKWFLSKRDQHPKQTLSTLASNINSYESFSISNIEI